VKDRQQIKQELHSGLGEVVAKLNVFKTLSDKVTGGQYHIEEEQFDFSQNRIVVSYDNKSIRTRYEPRNRPRRVILAEVLLNDENLEAIVAGRYSLTTRNAARKVGQFLHNFAHEHHLRNNVLHEY